MSPPQQLRQRTSNCSSLLIYRPRKDERLSWPCWLTYSGWFTHISGHPSATGRAQDSESTPAKDRCFTAPRGNGRGAHPPISILALPHETVHPRSPVYQMIRYSCRYTLRTVSATNSATARNSVERDLESRATSEDVTGIPEKVAGDSGEAGDVTSFADMSGRGSRIGERLPTVAGCTYSLSAVVPLMRRPGHRLRHPLRHRDVTAKK